VSASEEMYQWTSLWW